MSETLLERLGREIGERWKADQIIWSERVEPGEALRDVSGILSAEIEARLALVTREQAETHTDALVQLLALNDLLTYVQPEPSETPDRAEAIKGGLFRVVASLRTFLENAGAEPAERLGVADYFPPNRSRIAARELLRQAKRAA